MKRLAAIIAALALILASAVFVSADTLSIEKITPKDGATGKQPSNMAIKIRFSEDMNGGDDLDAVNSDKITIMQRDVSSKEAVDEIFEKAEEIFDFIGIF